MSKPAVRSIKRSLPRRQPDLLRKRKDKGEPSLGSEGEGHGSGEDLGSTRQEPPGVEGVECGHSRARNWRGPLGQDGDRHSKGESERGIVPIEPADSITAGEGRPCS